MYTIAVGVSHKKTSVEVRERLAFNDTQLPDMFEKLRASEKVAGCVILSTCNRTEIYAACKDVKAALSEIWNLLSAESGIKVEQLREYLYSITCEQVINHLFRVAAGMDSMILGETEILGQVSRAYRIACENSASNTVLNALFQRALKLGKQVRSETRIGEGASSVGSAAIDLAKRVFGDIQGRSVLLIGAGEIGRLVAQSLSSNGASEVMVCNRSYSKAKKLASQFCGRAAPFEKLNECIPEADLIVSCTAAPDYIITKEQSASLVETRSDRPILLIDLAVPRDIDPGLGRLPHVHLYNIDDLQSIVDESLDERRLEAEKAESIIKNAIDNFTGWLNSRHAVPVIKALHERGAQIRDAELEKALKKLGPVTDREEKILRSMANSIATKLMNTPIVQLREYAQTDQGHLYAQVLRNLFDLPVHIDDETRVS